MRVPYRALSLLTAFASAGLVLAALLTPWVQEEGKQSPNNTASWWSRSSGLLRYTNSLTGTNATQSTLSWGVCGSIGKSELEKMTFSQGLSDPAEGCALFVAASVFACLALLNIFFLALTMFMGWCCPCSCCFTARLHRQYISTIVMLAMCLACGLVGTQKMKSRDVFFSEPGVGHNCAIASLGLMVFAYALYLMSVTPCCGGGEDEDDEEDRRHMRKRRASRRGRRMRSRSYEEQRDVSEEDDDGDEEEDDGPPLRKTKKKKQSAPRPSRSSRRTAQPPAPVVVVVPAAAAAAPYPMTAPAPAAAPASIRTQKTRPAPRASTDSEESVV